MAQRRMFSKTITNSSGFLMMPNSAQNLYFHLGMNADDDGFVEHFAIMRMTESKPDDLKILYAKEFVKIFDDKVLVIKDWKENNYIRSDRYTPSKYLELYKDEIKKISEKIDIGGTIELPSGIPDDNQVVDKRDTQVRLGKDSIDKDTYNSIFEFWNNQENLIKHKKITLHLPKIKQALKNFNIDEIEKAIEKYNRVKVLPDSLYTYSWVLKDFLDRGLIKFATDQPDSDYIKKDFNKQQEKKESAADQMERLGLQDVNK